MIESYSNKNNSPDLKNRGFHKRFSAMKKLFTFFLVTHFIFSCTTCSEKEKIQRQHSQVFSGSITYDTIPLPKNHSGSFQDVALSDSQESSLSTPKKASTSSHNFLSCLLCCCKTKPEKMSEGNDQE